MSARLIFPEDIGHTLAGNRFFSPRRAWQKNQTYISQFTPDKAVGQSLKNLPVIFYLLPSKLAAAHTERIHT